MTEDKQDKSARYTKYEKARIIGARALQISAGAPFVVRLGEEELRQMRYNTLDIAKLEFEKGLIPITVHKPMPSIPEDDKAFARKLLMHLKATEEKQQAD
ncbi:DNA-directed RNA polymerase subunit K [Candidatus Woesearchaeota archaeon]|nr:DNA-directed RNA polymerase subunit K [Candidatus Woesearchaeota archaeon]